MYQNQTNPSRADIHTWQLFQIKELSFEIQEDVYAVPPAIKTHITECGVRTAVPVQPK
ncbi:MAG: hypothetical protein WD512_00230 [Candidatus Paceibacterota bacterium]